MPAKQLELELGRRAHVDLLTRGLLDTLRGASRSYPRGAPEGLTVTVHRGPPHVTLYDLIAAYAATQARQPRYD
jgi:hypothetical protein